MFLGQLWFGYTALILKLGFQFCSWFWRKFAFLNAIISFALIWYQTELYINVGIEFLKRKYLFKWGNMKRYLTFLKETLLCKNDSTWRVSICLRHHWNMFYHRLSRETWPDQKRVYSCTFKPFSSQIPSGRVKICDQSSRRDKLASQQSCSKTSNNSWDSLRSDQKWSFSWKSCWYK